MSRAFRSSLHSALGIYPPDSSFVAMDYHIDWINASLFLALPENDDSVVHPNPELNPIATGTQEDIDLLVAFEEDQTTHLLLIEAKAATSWTNKQTLSKAKRFGAVFGKNGDKYPQVKPYFCLTSPKLPQLLESDKWPSWMTRDGQPIWFSLDMPSGRRKVTRCDERGKPSVNGRFFRVVHC